MVAASFTACSGDDDTAPGGRGGEGGETVTAGSGGETAGTKNGEGGGGAGAGGHAGGVGGHAAGAGGDSTDLVGDYTVVASFDTEADALVSWSGKQRLAVLDWSRDVIDVFGINEGNVARLETYEPDDLLDGAKGISALAPFGDGLVIVVTNSATPTQQHVVQLQPGEEPEMLIAVPETEYVLSIVADPAVGVVISTQKGVQLAEPDATAWKTLFDDRRPRALGLEANRVLVGVEERMREEEGMGGAGGAGGAGSDSARLVWLDFDGNPVEEYEAFGNPQVAVKDEAGWLIGETNSFWGSYNAGIELLTDDGLQLLTRVPVISAGDGTDGAYDLFRDGDRLLVANCESGLLRGQFSTTELELDGVDGPWVSDNCSPRAIDSLNDLVVIGGSPLVFLRRSE